MKATRTRARIIGALFIAAAVFSILGLLLEGPALNNPEYILEGPTSEHQVVLGAYFELIAAATMVGTAITFYPIFRDYDGTLGIGYVCFRLFEAVLVVVGAVSVLALLALRLEYASGTALDDATLETTRLLLLSVHDLLFITGPNFMLGINTAMAAYVLYRTKLVPRGIATLGLVGAVGVSIAAVLALFGIVGQFSIYGGLLALPIFAYEMSLAVWLIVKGFEESETISGTDMSKSDSTLFRQS